MVSGAQAWDERYSHPNHVFGYRPNDFLAQSDFLLRPGARVLCLAEGEGRNAVHLAKLGCRVTAVDFSQVGLDKGKRLADEAGVEIDWQCADLSAWVHTDAARGPWDGVVSIFFHTGVDAWRDIASALLRQMAPHGVLILESYTPAQLSLGSGGPDHEDVLLTRERVTHIFEGWKLDVRLLERRIFEGMGHQGLSSVIQVLAQPLVQPRRASDVTTPDR